MPVEPHVFKRLSEKKDLIENLFSKELVEVDRFTGKGTDRKKEMVKHWLVFCNDPEELIER